MNKNKPAETKQPIEEPIYSFTKKISTMVIKNLILFIVIIFLLNIVFILLASIKVLTSGNDSNTQTIWFISLLLVCLLFSIFGGFKMYKNSTNEAIFGIYKQCRPLFKIAVKVMVEQAQNVYASGKTIVANEENKKLFGLSSLLKELLDKLPAVFNRMFSTILNKIPVLDILIEQKANFEAGKKEEITKIVFEKIDTFLTEHFFDTNLKWMFWYVPLNIFLAVYLIMQL